MNLLWLSLFLFLWAYIGTRVCLKGFDPKTIGGCFMCGLAGIFLGPLPWLVIWLDKHFFSKQIRK